MERKWNLQSRTRNNGVCSIQYCFNTF